MPRPSRRVAAELSEELLVVLSGRSAGTRMTVPCGMDCPRDEEQHEAASGPQQNLKSAALLAALSGQGTNGTLLAGRFVSGWLSSC
jgi:hypothetical protein